MKLKTIAPEPRESFCVRLRPLRKTLTNATKPFTHHCCVDRLKLLSTEGLVAFVSVIVTSLVTQIDHYIAGRNLRRSDVLEKAILAYLSFLEGKEAR